MLTHPPEQPGKSRSIPSQQDNVIDIVSRLPARPPTVDSPPERANVVTRARWRSAALVLAVGILVGVGLERLWTSRAVGQHLMALLTPHETSLPWNELGGAPLRLAPPLLSEQDLEPTVDALMHGPAPLGSLLPFDSWMPVLLTASAFHTLRACAPLPSEACLEPAIDALELVRHRSSDSPEALNNLAVALALAGRREEALEMLRSALTTVPGDPVVLFNAAQVCRVLNPEGTDLEKSLLHRYLQLETDGTYSRLVVPRFKEITSSVTRGAVPQR